MTGISPTNRLDQLPDIWQASLLPTIQQRNRQRRLSIVVLDDDPTGTQTVHQLPVLTEWTATAIQREFRRGTAIFYILTNSRSLECGEARALARQIGSNLREAGGATSREFVVVSRSDSTLRGHYPGEVDSLAEGLGIIEPVHVIIPFFQEGGRLTVDDVHYVRQEHQLVPASETPFARDPVFGYRHSNLKQWVEEKTGGRWPASDVFSIGIQQIRNEGPAGVLAALSRMADAKAVVVNAAEYRDLEVAVSALVEFEQQGRPLIYRTAASFVRVRAGMDDRPLLSPAALDLPSEGSVLFVVGSHVPQSTNQLRHLLNQTNTHPIEFDVRQSGSDTLRGAEIGRVARELSGCLQRKENVVVFTSRELITAGSDAENLAINRAVSDGLVEVVRRQQTRPRLIVAKGGITSSDLATKALGIRRGWVLGQILPGVPVWRSDEGSRWPGLPLVVFPGNVGGTDALTQIVASVKNHS